MKALVTSLLLVILLHPAIAQLSGTKTVCASGCDYPTLGTPSGVFAAINTQGLSGNLIITINGDLTNEVGLTPLNAIASSFSVTIKPSAAVLRTISCPSAGQIPISISGADNITIDGSFGGSGRYLLFRNNPSSGSNTAVRFTGGAVNDVLTNCIIENNSSTASQAPVLVNTGTNKVTINNCDIRPPTTGNTNSPLAGIYSNSPTNRLTITNNFIHNFSVVGIDLQFTGDSSIITGNSLYNSLIFTVLQTVIFISGGTSSGHTVSNNYIGGSAPLCAGAPWVNSGNVAFSGIKIDAGLNHINSLQGNVIQNINLTNTGTSTSFHGMDLITGNHNVGNISGNVIGHPSAPNSIAIAGDAIDGAVGIYVDNSSAPVVNISNNTIANISTLSSPGALDVTGILYDNFTGNITVTGNTVHSLYALNKVTGIFLNTVTTTLNTVAGNTVFDLLAANTTGNATVIGLLVGSSTSNNVSRNKIYDLRGPSVDAQIIGIKLPHSGLLANNQVTLTNNGSTNTVTIIGIYAGDNDTLYYNTVYIGGNTTTTNLINSYAYLSENSSSGGQRLQNNIFYNGRTGGNNFHTNYAIGYQGISWSAGSSNYNLLVSVDAFYLAYWANYVYPYVTFPGWKTASSGDSNSWSTTTANIPAANFFTDINTGNLDIINTNPEAWYVAGKGLAINGLTGDCSNAVSIRPQSISAGAPDIGADEFIPTNTPPAPTVTGTIGVGNTQTFDFAGRTLGTILWTGGSSLPTTINWQYHSGVNPPGNLSNHYANAYWTVTQTGGSNFTYNIKFFYDTATLGTATETAMLVAKKNEAATHWTTFASSSLNLANQSITLLGANSFSHFTLSDFISPLPIKLISFSATPINSAVRLDWQTGNEEALSSFELQHSTDNTNFETLSSITPQGNSSNYSFIDQNPKQGNNFYRLRMTDTDGETIYSNTAIANFRGNTSITVYPNPVKDELNIRSNGSPAEAKIFDMTGRLLKKITINDEQTSINLSDLITGSYILRYDSAGQTTIFKIEK